MTDPKYLEWAKQEVIDMYGSEEDAPGCECCCDSHAHHLASQRENEEYWFDYFGRGDRAVHAAMKPVTQEDYEEAWHLKQELNK